MVLEMLCVEPIYPKYSGVIETCLALMYWFFEELGSESVNVRLNLSNSNNRRMTLAHVAILLSSTQRVTEYLVALNILIIPIP